MHISLRFTISVSLILVALTFLINAVVDTPFFHRIVNDKIHEQVEAHTNASFDFNALSLQFFPPGLDVYGVSVKDSRGQEFLSATRMEARISLESILWGRPVLSSLGISELRAQWPIPDDVLKKSQEEGSSGSERVIWPPEFDLPIKTLNLYDSSIDINARQQQDKNYFAARLEGLNLTLDFDSWNDWDSEVSIARSSLLIDGAHILNEASFSSVIGAEENNIKMSQVKLSSPRIELSGDTDIDFLVKRERMNMMSSKRLFENHLLGLSIASEFIVQKMDMGILGDFLGAEESTGIMDGLVRFKGEASLEKSDFKWSITGKTRSYNAILSGFKLLESDLSFSVDDKKFMIDHAVIRESRQQEKPLATARGSIGFKKDIPIDFEIKPDNLPLKTLLDILKVPDFDVIESHLFSQSLKLTGQGQPLKLKLNGATHFEDMTTGLMGSSKTNFPAKPKCLIRVNLVITSEAVNIPSNEGLCSHPKFEDSDGDLIEESPLKIDGRISYSNKEGINLKVSSPSLNAKLLNHFTNISTKGLLDLDTVISGPYDDLKISLKQKAKNFFIAGFEGQNLELEGTLSLEKSSLSFKKLRIRDSANGYLSLDNAVFDLDDLVLKTFISIRNLNSKFINDGIRYFNPDYNLDFGIKSLDGHIRVPVQKPLASQGNITLKIENGRFNEEDLFSEISGKIISDKDKITTENLQLKLDEWLLDIKYSQTRSRARSQQNDDLENLGLNRKDKFKLEIKTNNSDEDLYLKKYNPENHLGNLPFIGSKFQELKLGALIDIAVKYEGDFNKAQGSFQGYLNQLFIFGSPTSPLTFSGFFDESKIDIPLIKHGGNSLVGRLSLNHRDPGIPYKAYLFLDQFDARAFLSPYFAEDPRNFYYLSADLEMAGNFNDFFNSEGRFVTKSVNAQFVQGSGQSLQKMTLKSSENIVVNLKKDSWTFADRKNLSLIGDGFEVSVDLKGNNPPENLNFKVKSTVDLQILKRLVPQIETAQGKVVIEASLRGSVADPIIEVTIKDQKKNESKNKEWEDVSIGFIDFSPAITNITVDMIYRNGSLLINSVKGSKGQQGNIHVKGLLDFNSQRDSLIQINLKQVELNRLNVPVFKSADATVSGDINVFGNQPPFTITGNLNLDEVSSVTDFDIRKQILSSIRKGQVTPPVSLQSPILDFDLNIYSDETITIKNKNVDMVFSADLSIKGNEQKPIILGQVESVRGTFKYRRDFTIKKSFISFEEPVYPPDPRLDIVGEAEVKTSGTNYTIGIAINGKVSNPKLSLTIDPPTRPDGTSASKIDILLLLTTGRIPEIDSTSQSALKNEAFSLFVGYAEAPIENIIDLTGQQYIRQIYVDTYLPTDEDDVNPVARANLPISMTDDLSLIVQVDQASNVKGSFQYSLHEKITLSGSIDSRSQENAANENNDLPADTGIDLKFRFSFD